MCTGQRRMTSPTSLKSILMPYLTHQILFHLRLRMLVAQSYIVRAAVAPARRDAVVSDQRRVGHQRAVLKLGLEDRRVQVANIRGPHTARHQHRRLLQLAAVGADNGRLHESRRKRHRAKRGGQRALLVHLGRGIDVPWESADLRRSAGAGLALDAPQTDREGASVVWHLVARNREAADGQDTRQQIVSRSCMADSESEACHSTGCAWDSCGRYMFRNSASVLPLDRQVVEAEEGIPLGAAGAAVDGARGVHWRLYERTSVVYCNLSDAGRPRFSD
ncbi:hypothetical protein G3M48_005226 [Beauveria asiatica]|uniref:Uncharacterized protein n=1 Tax=Beauveria asiatica TaxID=1069075 RepID=A0AAW0RRJ0_9HYPO